MLIVDQGRLSTLLGHTPIEAERPQRRDCGHGASANQLALLARSEHSCLTIGLLSSAPSRSDCVIARPLVLSIDSTSKNNFTNRRRKG
jgi:hypothetical protein